MLLCLNRRETHRSGQLTMYLNRFLLLVLILLYVLAPILADWVSRSDIWYRPQLFWLVIIVLVSLAMNRNATDEP